MNRELHFLFVFFALFIFSFTARAQESQRSLVCEGHDSRARIRFFYEVQIQGDVAETKLYLHQPDSEMIIGESQFAKVTDEKFEVPSPYADLRARIAFERDYWILDLMEMNGNFVIPTYDYFDCLEKISQRN